MGTVFPWDKLLHLHTLNSCNSPSSAGADVEQKWFRRPTIRFWIPHPPPPPPIVLHTIQCRIMLQVIKNTLHPTWVKFEISSQTLCSSDPSKKIKVWLPRLITSEGGGGSELLAAVHSSSSLLANCIWHSYWLDHDTTALFPTPSPSLHGVCFNQVNRIIISLRMLSHYSTSCWGLRKPASPDVTAYSYVQTATPERFR